jgi:AcrR family transcriptional regulator
MSSLSVRLAAPGPATQDKKRSVILDAARSVIALKGFATAKIADIAARARVSSRTIYDHFESKHALLDAMLQTDMAAVRAAFPERSDGANSATDFFQHHATRIAEVFASPHAETLAGMYLSERHTLAPKTHAAIQAAFKAVERQLKVELENAVKHDVPDADDRVARLLGEMQHKLLFARLAGAAMVASPQQVAQTAVTHALAGLTPP